MWLPWQYSLWLAVASAVVAVVLRVRTPPQQWFWVRELARETAIFATLYTIWQRIGQLPASNDAVLAVRRGTAIAHLEHVLHFPSEGWTQRLALHSHLVVEGANWYYIVGHTPVLGVFLVWLYLRHRGDFARWRTVLAFSCIVGELIQIVPVAPPRLALHDIIDTGQVFGPAVYESDGAGLAPQLAAMPSLHCVWATTTGLAVFLIVRSRWRWLGPAHVVLTVLVIVITGNHYWLDAAAGIALVLVGLAIYDGSAYLRRRWTRRHSALSADVAAEPIDAGEKYPHQAHLA
jgi:hypothetical protein